MKYVSEAAKEVLIVTRFRLRSPWLLPFALWRFHKLGRAAAQAPGYLGGVVALASPSIIVNVSRWTSWEEMRRWTGCDEHVHAVRKMYRWASAAWSAESDRPVVSRSASNWLIASGRHVSPSPW